MAMSFIVAVSLYAVGFVFFTYVCMIADPETSPLASFFTEVIPKFLLRQMKNLLGEKVSRIVEKASDYFLLVMYLVVVLGAWSIMFAYGYPLISESKHVSSFHRIAGYILFVACMSSWRHVSKSNPGYINERTIAKFDNYPYDNLLYVNKVCPTMHIRKLARSKFDRGSQRHVARFDHYCGWLNNPIGEENYRFFILFLIIHVVMCLYGSTITALLFRGEILEKDLWNVTFFNAVTGRQMKSDRTLVFHYLLSRHLYLAGALLLMSVMGIVLTVFLVFHIYLTVKGMTTNEFFKWRQVRKWHEKEVKRFKAAVKEADISAVTTATDVPVVDKNVENVGIEVVDDVNIGCVERPIITKTTTRPSIALLRSPGDITVDNNSDEIDGIDDHGNNIDNNDKKVETDEKTASSFNNNIETHNNEAGRFVHPGPMPRNIYDHGIYENLKEVIFPRSLRNDALGRWTDSCQQQQQQKGTVTTSATSQGKSKAKNA